MNPLRVSARDSIRVRAGSSSRVEIDLGAGLVRDLPSPAIYLRQNLWSAPLEGRSRSATRADFVRLGRMQYPQEWRFEYAGATLTLETVSSSQAVSGSELLTRTEVSPD